MLSRLRVRFRFAPAVFVLCALAFAPVAYCETPAATTEVIDPRSDVDRDGIVDEEDLFIMMRNWRRTVPAASQETTCSGAVVGRVLSQATSAPLAGATITLCDVAARPIRHVFTSGSGDYVLAGVPRGYYRIQTGKDGYVPTELFHQVEPNRTDQAATVYLASGAAETGTAIGKVVSAANGGGVSGALVELRVGVNATLGAANKVFTTISGGNYSATSLPAGTYTVRVTRSGYETGGGRVVIVSGTSTAQPDIALSPLLGAGQRRVVLTWGNTLDLDVHLTGPLASGQRFHVFYDTTGSLTAEPFCRFDLDDRDGYGPETITLGQRIPGVYRISVHNYDDRENPASVQLSQESGAMVQVFDEQGLIQEYTVPSGGMGDIWRVFELDGTTGEITAVHTFHSGSPGDISNFKGGLAEDMKLLLDAPAK